MNNNNGLVRPPAVAGQFYEGDKSSLEKDLEKLFANCAEISDGFPDTKVRALISPHAGYVYSGQTAAKVFSLIKKFNYKRAIIIAPSHQVPFSGLAVADYSAYKTPLGDVKVDIDICSLLYETPAVTELKSAHEYEHALEVQLPFLQKLQPDLSIVPLVCGQLDDKTAELAAEALLPYWNSDTLWIISSDFTHYGHSFGYVPFKDNVPENLKKLDLGAADKIVEMDCEGFSEYIEETGATICGSNPIKLLLKTIELSKPDDKVISHLVDYTTSGELAGDYSHCVSYAGIAFFEKEI